MELLALTSLAFAPVADKEGEIRGENYNLAFRGSGKIKTWLFDNQVKWKPRLIKIGRYHVTTYLLGAQKPPGSDHPTAGTAVDMAVLKRFLRDETARISSNQSDVDRAVSGAVKHTENPYDWLIDCMIEWLNIMIDWLAAWLIGWLVGWLVGWLID